MVGATFPTGVVVSDDPLFGKVVGFHQLPDQDFGVFIGFFHVVSLMDTKFDPDGVGIGDAVSSFAVSTVPRDVFLFDDFQDSLVVDKVVGAGPSVAAVKVTVVGHGISALSRVGGVVDDEVHNRLTSSFAVVSLD